jgi:hypothetical protein
MNQRKPSKGLTSKQRSFVSDAAHQAKRAGTPLTIWLTFTAPPTVTHSQAATANLFLALRKKVAVEACRKEFASANVWTVEANEDGTNPHMNMLVHVPPEERKGFLEVVLKWLPGGGVLWDDIDPDRDIIGYITKQLDHKATFVQRVPYNPGLYFGKRCGATKSLIVSPIKSYRSSVAAYQSPQQNRAA